MFLKKIEGPRAVKLAAGKNMTRADLPAIHTRRWVASRKAAVVRGIQSGLISRAEAVTMWSLSEEEIDEWMGAVDSHGEVALKATLVQKYRQP